MAHFGLPVEDSNIASSVTSGEAEQAIATNYINYSTTTKLSSIRTSNTPDTLRLTEQI